MSEALRLADELDALMDEESLVGAVTIDRAAAELRRLHALNAELVEALRKAVKLNSFREFNDHIPAMKAALEKAKASNG